MDVVQAIPRFNQADIAKALLLATNTEYPPTDSLVLAGYLSLTVEASDPLEYGLGRDVRAFLWPEKRFIGFHPKLEDSPKRKTFSILHEIGHFVLPGHTIHPDLLKPTEKNYLIIGDDNIQLSYSYATVEVEANRFAADCLFQLEHFDRHIISNNLTWAEIMSAADEYGASFEATARRWVERAPFDCALIVFSPAKRTEWGSPLKLLYSIVSSSFGRKYFQRLPQVLLEKDSLVHRIFYRMEFQEDPQSILKVRLLPDSEPTDFVMHLFSNGYRIFGLIAPDSAR